MACAKLLRGGLQRLAGQSDQATFELRQAMGGGKTHSMLALGLLARNPHLRHLAPEDVTAGIHLPSTKVVAINGRAISDEIYIWGEIASQLDKRELFARFWRDVPKAPNEPDWIQLIGDEPVLILLDELPPYFEYAQTQQVGGGTLAQVVTFALANLLSAALKLPRCCIVVSRALSC
jgi:predicted AAA+ superfamily ATPase